MSSRPTPKHWEMIIDYFEKNPEMVSGRAAAPNAKQVIKKKWVTLATRLNSLGYTNKSSEKWLKTWTDFKSALKKKAAEIKQDQKGTGGGPPSCKHLNEYEERALQLLGTSFIGLNIPEAGLTPTVTPTNNSIQFTLTPTSINQNNSTASTSCRKIETELVCSPPSTPTATPRHTTSASSTSRVEKRTLQVSQDEHNYMKRRKNENLMEEAYGKTILTLENIEEKLDSIDQKMGSIADSLKIIAEKL